MKKKRKQEKPFQETEHYVIKDNDPERWREMK